MNTSCWKARNSTLVWSRRENNRLYQVAKRNGRTVKIQPRRIQYTDVAACHIWPPKLVTILLSAALTLMCLCSCCITETASLPEISTFTLEGWKKHADQTRFIPVHELFEQLTPQQHAILMPIYCLTVCETVSSAHFMGMARGWHSVFQCRRVSIITKHCQPLETTPFQRENSCNPLCR